MFPNSEKRPSRLPASGTHRSTTAPFSHSTPIQVQWWESASGQGCLHRRGQAGEARISNSRRACMMSAAAGQVDSGPQTKLHLVRMHAPLHAKHNAVSQQLRAFRLPSIGIWRGSTHLPCPPPPVLALAGARVATNSCQQPLASREPRTAAAWPASLEVRKAARLCAVLPARQGPLKPSKYV